MRLALHSIISQRVAGIWLNWSCWSILFLWLVLSENPIHKADPRTSSTSLEVPSAHLARSPLSRNQIIRHAIPNFATPMCLLCVNSIHYPLPNFRLSLSGSLIGGIDILLCGRRRVRILRYARIDVGRVNGGMGISTLLRHVLDARI